MAESAFNIGDIQGQIKTINDQIVTYVNIPYSDFSWISQFSYFSKSNVSPTSLGLTTIYGFLVYCTNGGAVMGVRYKDNNEIQVHGIIAQSGNPITNSYEFVCYAVGKK